ncbi:MAG: CDP-diacylglycerol--serine O-phosphatidyltransferase [Bacteroidales bacterium]|nr:CDP-diacylglycerol--serine O-phosphatidyltransferase [Bacteroidales bacterium]
MNYFFYKLKNNVPNTFTILNLICGIISIIASFENHLIFSSIFIYLGFIFDYIDGFTARLLKSQTKIGKELDSLADLVTFGLAPSIIIFVLMKKVLVYEYIPDTITLTELLYFFFPILIPVFSAIRLAKFNTDNRQTDKFIGLPTPANAFFIAWLPVMLYKLKIEVFYVILNIKVLIILSVINSLLLVSPFTFFSFKFKNFKYKNNKQRYLFLILSILTFILYPLYSVPIIFAFYVLSGIYTYAKNKFFMKVKP